MIRRKKAAMEMSVGTIVTIVLLVSVLILGIFLVQKIFGSAKKVIDMTDAQVTSEINELFAEENKLVIYPQTRSIKIKQEEVEGVGLGIKNLLQGGTGEEIFSYEVVVGDASDCKETDEQVLSWIRTGKTIQNIRIPIGDLSIQRVTFRIPTGSSLCIPRYNINVYVDEQIYASEFFEVVVQPK